MEYQHINNVCFCLALRKPTRLITVIYDRGLAHLGIRATQVNLLAALHYNNKNTLTDLSIEMAMDRTTITRNLKLMHKQGLIIPARPVDSRSKMYELTAEGKQKLAGASSVWLSIQNDMRDRVGEEYFEVLVSEMKVLAEKLEDL